MASMMQYEGQASSGDSSRLEGGVVRDPVSFAAFQRRVDAEYKRSISSLIENEIIPRLMVAHATVSPPPVEADPGARLDEREIELFAPLVLQVEADDLLAHVEAILARGVTFETILVELLAPTARLLGDLWTEDRCDFVDVTMGLWRLQEIVHEISGRFPPSRSSAGGNRHALFSPMPGDQHSFGSVVIENIFRREGWQTDRLGDAETSTLMQRAADEWFDIIGLTVSCDCHIATVPSVIAALRNVSKNPQVSIMVGGGVFSSDPDLARQVGADGTARDARIALEVADGLVRERGSCVL